MTTAPPNVHVLGYSDRPSVRPGEKIAFHVSCDHSEGYDAELVRLRHGDLAPEGPGMKIETIPSDLAGHHKGRTCSTPAGSFAVLPEHDWLPPGSWAVAIRVCPWTRGTARETLLHCADGDGLGLVVYLYDERFHATVTTAAGATTVSSEARVDFRCWYEVRVAIRAGELALEVDPAGHPAASRLRFRPQSDHELHVVPQSQPARFGAAELWLGAEPDGRGAPFASHHFNGKLEGPRFYGSGGGEHDLVVDFSAELIDLTRHEQCSATGRSGASLVGTVYNRPTRAVTGSEWTSYEDDFRAAPDRYAAIHFHADDLADASWPVSHSFTVPEDLPSGIYALRLRAGTSVDHVPFAVRPRDRQSRAQIALLLPTATYLAYANDKFGPDAEFIQIMGRIPVLGPEAVYGHLHRELGSSLYDIHPDGSGVCFSSWRRPLLNMRPGRGMALVRAWNFNVDLQLVDWLTEKGFEFDVITDHDLHAEGHTLIDGYRTVLTASHSEYVSGPMLDALEEYVEAGGRLMYMGGNGFYWVTAFDPTGSGAVEIRRFGGTEPWTTDPGQVRLQFSGEIGGTWRARGRAPQRLAGVGFVAMGLDVSGSYLRLDPAVRGPSDSWVFAGVEGDVVGDFGLAGDGAAGLEIDAVDQRLGTPPQTEILASSVGHSDLMLEARENVGATAPNMGGVQNPAIRSDLTLFELENGGSVFSVGSIAWCSSLSHNHYENSVSRVTENVLRRFSGMPE